MPSTFTSRLEGLTTSVAVKAPCRVATTAAITLSGLQAVDGVALSAGDRVLVKNQNEAIDNGIWIASVGAWTRAADFDGTLDAVGGTQVFVLGGSTHGNTNWRVLGVGDVNIGQDEVWFAAVRFRHSVGEAYWFESVASMVEDVEFTYAPGSDGGKIVFAGDYVEAGGFRYEVAAADASDHDLATSGGVKLYVQPDSEGRYSPCMWGMTGDGSAADNQAAMEACLAKCVATGAAHHGPGGTYDFLGELDYSGIVSYWDGTIMMLQADTWGIKFGDGATFTAVFGNLRVQKGAGGSGPVTIDGNGYANMAGTATGDHGVIFGGRVMQVGIVDAIYMHDSGIVFDASENCNHCYYTMVRGFSTGKYGIECRGTQNDNALWHVNFRAWGCWDSGMHIPDTYYARTWTGIIGTERNCNKGSGDEFYAGGLRECMGGKLEIYSENHIGGVTEIHISGNSQYVQYVNTRNNDTVIDATRADTIVNVSGRNQLLNPVLSFDRCTAIQPGSPSRYTREILETSIASADTILREWRTSGDWVRLALLSGGVLTESFGFRADGNIDVMRNGKGIRLVSPDGGTVRYLTIDNSGQVALLSTAP